MSVGKHTPGPWFLDELDHAGQRVVRQQHIEICTCWHHSVGSIEREMEANACLIAAAPELLEMCRRYADFIRTSVKAADLEMHPYLPELEALLAKAGAS